jgi:5-methyltetrahydropteroyltriglutamate--homocysteine methyltransferase
MKRSTDRILVYHAGALAKPDDVRQMVEAREAGRPYDLDLLNRRLRESVAQQVAKQVEIGIDFVNDGEQSKSGFSYYIAPRLSGIVQREPKPGEDVLQMDASARDRAEFPEYYATRGGRTFQRRLFFAEGPIHYTGQEIIQTDIANFKAALQGKTYAEAILPVIAVGSIEHWIRNVYYPSEEDFLFALADAMHEEYKAIADAGIILQLDDPDLPDGYHVHPEMSVEDYRKFARVRVEAINHAIRDIPEEMVRLHICWGSFHHPHTQDIPLRDIVDLVFAVKAQCYSIEASNPQHEHEWEVFKEVRLPEGKILMPGVSGHCAPEFVEHPRVVAQRLLRYAGVVGRENLIAGTDCGLSRVANAEVQWAKFRAMAEGARIASDELWGRG